MQFCCGTVLLCVGSVGKHKHVWSVHGWLGTDGPYVLVLWLRQETDLAKHVCRSRSAQLCPDLTDTIYLSTSRAYGNGSQAIVCLFEANRSCGTTAVAAFMRSSLCWGAWGWHLRAGTRAHSRTMATTQQFSGRRRCCHAL